jgi:hypothetical protein
MENNCETNGTNGDNHELITTTTPETNGTNHGTLFHEITEDEAALYDRQIRLWGVDAQRK